MKLFIGKVHNVIGCNVKVYIERNVVDRKYGKTLKRTTKLLVHDNIGVKEGDLVSVKECPPVSKMKRHMIVEVLKWFLSKQN